MRRPEKLKPHDDDGHEAERDSLHEVVCQSCSLQAPHAVAAAGGGVGGGVVGGGGAGVGGAGGGDAGVGGASGDWVTGGYSLVGWMAWLGVWFGWKDGLVGWVVWLGEKFNG